MAHRSTSRFSEGLAEESGRENYKHIRRNRDEDGHRGLERRPQHARSRSRSFSPVRSSWQKGREQRAGSGSRSPPASRSRHLRSPQRERAFSPERYGRPRTDGSSFRSSRRDGPDRAVRYDRMQSQDWGFGGRDSGLETSFPADPRPPRWGVAGYTLDGQQRAATVPGRDAQEDVCYVCGGRGHWARECPSKPAGIRSRAVSLHDSANGHHRLPIRPNLAGFSAGPFRGSGQDDSSNPKCYECGRMGHVARECPVKQGDGPIEQRCYECGSIGHIARDCPATRGAGGRALAPPPALPRSSGGADGCYHCGRRGHFARECPEKAPEGRAMADRWMGGLPPLGNLLNMRGLGMVGPSGSSFGIPFPGNSSRPALKATTEGCFECGQLGHFARECPMRSHRLAEKSAAAAGQRSGFTDAPSQLGRRIASKASMGGGRLQEARLNDDLETYMQERRARRSSSPRASIQQPEGQDRGMAGAPDGGDDLPAMSLQGSGFSPTSLPDEGEAVDAPPAADIE